eukprot:TRINITY_DN16054_c0_g1_i1.p1 TRINITY_DN16054_c0_g1~~TRINITY_DN16054_c0_g1_i1.p1  ORF type:complete len:224 (-),score=55.05 TRINITY_DN16054_c0_g1_i1:268-939(-)
MQCSLYVCRWWPQYVSFFFFFLMIRRPPRSTLSSSSAASDVYKRQVSRRVRGEQQPGHMPFVEGEDSEEDEEEVCQPQTVVERPAAPPARVPDVVVPNAIPGLLSTSVGAINAAPIPRPSGTDSPVYADPENAMQHRLRERNTGFRMTLGRRLEQILGGIKMDMNQCSKMFGGNLDALQDTNQTMRSVNADIGCLCETMETNKIIDGGFAFVDEKAGTSPKSK